MISVFHSDVEVYVCLTEQFEMFWRGVKGISSERKTYQGLGSFVANAPGAKRLTTPGACNATAVDRRDMWGRGVLAAFFDSIAWLHEPSAKVDLAGMDTVVGECWWYLLMLLKKIDQWHPHSRCFHHFSWVQAQCFSRLNPKIHCCSDSPIFAGENLWFLCVTFQFCVGFGFWWPLPGPGCLLVSRSRTWIPLAFGKWNVVALQRVQGGSKSGRLGGGVLSAGEIWNIIYCYLYIGIPSGYVKIAIKNGHL